MQTVELQDWATGGQYFEWPLFGHKVFYKEYGLNQAPAEKTLLVLHGFPESSFSFHKVVEGLASLFERIVLFDMLGYGLSDKPLEGFTYSLFEQADVTLSLWHHLGVTGGHLLSHDMGDSVATELATRQVMQQLPAWFSTGFRSFTFTNGGMVLELASLRITQKLLLSGLGHLVSKVFTYPVFRHQVRSAHGNDQLSEKDIAELWVNVKRQDGHRKTHLLIRYLEDRKRFERPRWLPALAKVELPVHICWGEDDAVARLEIAHYLKEKVCPSAAFTRMPGLGHFCQLGSPGKWLEHVCNFYQSLPS